MNVHKSLSGKSGEPIADEPHRVTIRGESLRLPHLSIVLPVRNEEAFIVNTLEQIVAQDYPPELVEILVVDGMSTDDTVAKVRELAGRYPGRSISVAENAKMLSSAARNIGVETSTGEFVIVIDGHVHIPGDQLLRDSALLALEHDVDVLGRPQHLNPPGINSFQRSVALVRSTRVGHSPESHIYSNETSMVSPISVAVMYRRSIFERYGLFDDQFDAAEDYEFNFRLEKGGEDCLISPRLEIFYYPRDSLYALGRQMFRYGLGRARFLRKHPERWTLNTAVPSAFLLTIAALLLLSFFEHRAGFVLAGLLAVYAVVVVAVCLREAGSKLRHSLRYVAIAFVVHTGLGLGFIRGFFR